MRRRELHKILEILGPRVRDEPSLKGAYDELLEAYFKTRDRPDWRVPIAPDITTIDVEADGTK